MRVTKEPEERRQEILDTAMRLFYEKGYEKTSITDIANAIGVAQGLCYRYFPSKEALFDTAIDQYAEELAGKFVLPQSSKPLTLKEILETMPMMVETEDTDYYKALHVNENRKFHDQLALKVCEKLWKPVMELLKYAQENGESCLDDIETAARFCVYGQLGILLDGDIPKEEKGERIRAFLLYALRL